MSDESTEDQGGDGGELDKDVDGRAGGVLEGVTNGVTDDGGSVLGVLLGNELTGVSVALVLTSEFAGFDELLGVVPSTTRVGGGEGNLDSGDDGTSEEAASETVAEDVSSEKGGNDNEGTRGDHLSEGSVGGDGNAGLVIGSVSSLDEGNLSADFSDHVLGGFTDGAHGEGGEGVGEHGTDEETGEGEGLEDVDFVGISVSEDTFRVGGLSNTGHEGTEESEGDEAGGANGETLTDSGGGVASGIEGVGGSSDVGVEVGHLSDSTGVVGDGTVSVNGEGNGEAAEHADGGKGNSVHSSPVEGEEDGDGEAHNGDDVGHVSKSESLDDVGGSIVVASFSELLGGAEGVGGVVLGGDSNDETGPETEDDASVDLPSGGGVLLAGELNCGGLGEDVDGGDKEDGHEDGGDDELGLQLVLNSHVDSGESNGDERDNNSDSGDDEGVVDGVRGQEEVLGGGRHDEGGAGGFSEGSEKIGAHTSDVTNVITDVVSNGAGVEGGVFVNALADFASEVSTDISSLGVDTTTDSSEESDGGATETVSGNEFEKFTNLSLEEGVSLLLTFDDSSLVGEKDDLEDEESHTDEGETEDLTTVEGDLETLIDVDAGEVGGLDVGVGSDSHANEASSHGGDGTDEEGDSGVHGEAGLSVEGLVDGANEEDSEEEAEDGEVSVFLLDEGVSALKFDKRDVSFNL